MFPDEEEQVIMSQIFEFAKDVIAMELTETELAMICSFVLIEPSKSAFPFL